MVPYFELYLAFIFAVTALHTFLDLRQLKALKQPCPPALLKSRFDQDTYLKIRQYSVEKWYFGFVHGLFELCVTLITLLYLPQIWQVACQLEDRVANITGTKAKSEIVQTIVFALISQLATSVLGLPWSLYSTFVVEQRHGFNKQTLGLYFYDFVLSVLLTAVIMPPIVGGLTHILQVAGPLLPVYLWAFMFLISVIGLTVYPTLIAPLFNKFEPLAEGNLRNKIEELAGSLNFPLKKLYTKDGSKRSAHSNAYMYGFFNNKRIVIYDTLIQQCTEDEVVAVLGHELGHWKLRHTPVLFTVQQGILIVMFTLYTIIRNSSELMSAFGFVESQPVFIRLTLFLMMMSPLNEVLSFLVNMVSRMFEFQADAFAVKLGKGGQLREALLKLQKENKSSLHVDPWYSAYHYSHPPLIERLNAIDTALKKAL